MIPSYDEDLLEGIEEDEIEPSLNYKMNLDKERVVGSVDGLEAMKQVIFKILHTERYEYPIYSWDYGVELKDLIGRPMSYVLPELERVITEALEADDRIDSVDNFEFDVQKNKVSVTFTVHTIYGDLENDEMGVEVDV
jgi:phage baseplate assembly protein W